MKARIIFVLAAVFLLFAACNRTQPAMGLVTVTLGANLGSELAVQGVPTDSSGNTGISQAELTVHRDSTRIYFDAEANETDAPGVPLLLTPEESSITLSLHNQNYYSFYLDASDDDENLLAKGSLESQWISGATSLSIPLATLVAAATFSGPVTVQPNEVFDVYLNVTPPGRTDLRVPSSDYSVSYTSSSGVVTSSKRGVRVFAVCEAITVNAAVYDYRGELKAEPSLTIPVNTFCPGYNATAGTDMVPPWVRIDEPADEATVPINQYTTISGVANDGQSGINRVEIYEGVQHLGNATVDDSSTPATWAFEWFYPNYARDHTIVAVAIDNAGNESEATISITGNGDEEPGQTWFRDADGDGYGNPYDSIVSAVQPEGYVDNDLDCDDTNPDVHPAAEEIQDGIDNNCNGLVDEGFN